MLARARYQSQHPTTIAVLKCMDGRINIPVATGTPIGLPMPFRNLGGRFDLGWPHLGEVVTQYVMDRVHEGRQVLFLVMYHYSRGDHHHGCAGFDYDQQAAINHTQEIKQQISTIFGAAHGTVYPLVCGFETDEDALVLHGAHGQVLRVADLDDCNPEALSAKLAMLLPEMPGTMRAYLLPLVVGNFKHVAEIRMQVRLGLRQLDIEHREWMICLGRGFDFLHTPNLALIIGPYSPNLAEPIIKAAGIIQANMASARIPGDGFLLLSSVPYEAIGVDQARAAIKARFLSEFAQSVIRETYPELAKK
ncbi:MAG: hypothetical protein EoVTN8_1543 [Fluviibacter phosphoraccumulans EoVTN8]